MKTKKGYFSIFRPEQEEVSHRDRHKVAGCLTV